MATIRQNFSNRKSQWKKSNGILFRDIEKLFVKVRAGEIITMGDVYALAHRVNALGERGIDLARTAGSLFMRDHVVKEIQTNAHLLELYSKQLYSVLVRRDLSTTHFPLFESTLLYDTVVADDPLDELATIMGGTDEGPEGNNPETEGQRESKVRT
jgi:hypothetical protein